MNMRIKIGNRWVGKDEPVYVVAEIGINHNGNMELARETIDAAIHSGVDAVKFQSYITEDFISDRQLTYKYFSQEVEVEEAQYDMFKRCELSIDDLHMLIAYSRDRGIDVHSTPTNVRGVQYLVESGVSVLKNGSDYLTHLPLVKAMAETGLPVVLSTGMATLSEIDDVVEIFRQAGNEQLILLHCTSSYPTAANEVNIQRVGTLAKTFGCLAGFSDHTKGTVASVMSVMMSSCWIEKHFTLDKSLPGPDHNFSCDPDEMNVLVRSVREAEKMQGRSSIYPTKSEQHSRENYRLSCVAKDNIASGKVLNAKDIAFRRPGNGFPPKELYLFEGRKLLKDIKRGDALSLDHIV